MNRYRIAIALAIAFTVTSSSFAQRGRQALSENQQNAYGDLIAASADYHLGLTAEQRAQVSSAAVKKVSGQLERNPKRAVVEIVDITELLGYYTPANGGPMLNQAVREELNDILTPAQTKVMDLMFPQLRGEDRRMEEFRKAQQRLLAAANAGQIKREDIEKRLGELKARIWADERGEDVEKLAAAREKIIALVRAGKLDRRAAGEKLRAIEAELKAAAKDDNKRGNDGDKERTLAAAKLAAHIERLGTLDAGVQKRLALVSKGVVEQFLEGKEDGNTGRDRGRGEVNGVGVRVGDARLQQFLAETKRAAAAGEITREEAAQRIQGVRARMEIAAQRSRANQPKKPTGDITQNELFQQTIKVLLTDDAYAAYQKWQAGRVEFREQTYRGLALAGLENMMRLNGEQVEKLRPVAAKLKVPANGGNPTVTSRGTSIAWIMIAELVGAIDDKELTEDQRVALDRIGQRLQRIRGERRR